MNNEAEARKDQQQDKAVEMTFPASDPAAHGEATGTEPPRRPVDRTASLITTEQIEQAERGEGHNQSAAPAMGSHKPVDHADRETVDVRQGTGPRATVSVLFISLIGAAITGAVVVGYFVW